MSSWDRSRYIPWSKLSEVSNNEEAYNFQKERVFRSLQREAIREREEKEEKFVPIEITESRKGSLFKSGIEYQTSDVLRSLAFGGCIGSITGAIFGFMDGMKTAGENKILKNASNIAKAKYLAQGTSRSGFTFGLFFSVFHGLKYGIHVAANPGDVLEILGASALSIGGMMVKPATRVSIPYAGMLVAMDSFTIYMSEEK